MKNYKLYLASVALISLILLIWKFSYHYNCISLIFPIIIMLTISFGLTELVMHKKVCFQKCYIDNNSRLVYFLLSKNLTIFFYLILSFFMTVSLAYSVVEYETNFWIYIFVHINLTVFIFKFLQNKFKNILKKDYSSIVAREWTINISSILLIIVYIYLAYTGYIPEYLKDTLSETIREASSLFNSDCVLSNLFLKIKAEIDASMWYFMIHGAKNLTNDSQQYIAWIIFFLFNSFVVLSISRFIVQVVYLLDMLFKKDERKNKIER